MFSVHGGFPWLIPPQWATHPASVGKVAKAKANVLAKMDQEQDQPRITSPLSNGPGEISMQRTTTSMIESGTEIKPLRETVNCPQLPTKRSKAQKLPKSPDALFHRGKDGRGQVAGNQLALADSNGVGSSFSDKENAVFSS
eukprot:gene11509-9992_t